LSHSPLFEHPSHSQVFKGPQPEIYSLNDLFAQRPTALAALASVATHPVPSITFPAPATDALNYNTPSSTTNSVHSRIPISQHCLAVRTSVTVLGLVPAWRSDNRDGVEASLRSTELAFHTCICIGRRRFASTYRWRGLQLHPIKHRIFN
jgi:hypothetical protein